MMKRTSTGSDNLDLILGGGLEPGSVVFIAGEPGAGKTILAQQICFAVGSVEQPAVYYTLLAESHNKMINHLESFDFFDRKALGSSIELLDLRGFVAVDEGPRELLEGEPAVEHILTELARRAIETRPSVVVIDAVKALREVTSTTQFRRVLFDLTSRVAASGAILLLVGEYTEEEIRHDSEFAVCDGIIYLANDSIGRFDERSLRVLKMRGAAPMAGRHTFAIESPGIVVYPRLESTLRLAESMPAAEAEPGTVPIGIGELDVMMLGGVRRASTTLVLGPSGVGKTLVTLHFIAEGLARSERCRLLSFQQSEERLIQRAQQFGWDFRPAIESGQLSLTHLNPVEVSLDIVGADLRNSAMHSKIDRIAVDSLAEITPATRGTGRFPDYLSALAALFRHLGVTAMFTGETDIYVGPAFTLPHSLAIISDNVILIRYSELNSHVHRVINVLKMRESDHSKSLREVVIDSGGMHVMGKFVVLADDSPRHSATGEQMWTLGQ